MPDYIFSESKCAEDIINKENIKSTDLYKSIWKLALYNYFVLQMNSKDNYDSINNILKQKSEDYVEVRDYKIIDNCINKVKKHKWIEIEDVVITKEEMARISALNDDRKERIAFVLLADAKYNLACGKSDAAISYLSVNKIFTFARVAMPRKDRDLFLSFLYDEGLIMKNTNPTFNGKILNFASNNNDDDAIKLHEVDYKELGWTYLNWKNGGGYKRCKACGVLFEKEKKKKNMNAKEYCSKCKPEYVPIEFKTLQCIDCGDDFVVSANVATKCRCDECQKEETKKQWAIASKKYRDSKKSS